MDIDYTELGIMIAHTIVGKMQLEDLQDFVHDRLAEYYAKDVDDEELARVAGSLGIRIESYMIKGGA